MTAPAELPVQAPVGAPDAAGRGGGVQSLARAAALLRAIAARPGGTGLRELAAAVALAPSTAHRLLTALETEGLVHHDPQLGWQIGVACFQIGSAFLAGRDLRALARPHLRLLMEETGETASLYLAGEGELVCLDQVECRQLMRATTRVGGRVGLSHTSAGKAVLAALPMGEAQLLVARVGMARPTPRALADWVGLAAALEVVRAAGHAIDDEEHADGLRCVGAAILDEHRRPCAAVSISGPAARLPDSRLDAVAARVRARAAAITRAFGGAAA